MNTEYMLLPCLPNILSTYKLIYWYDSITQSCLPPSVSQQEMFVCPLMLKYIVL